MSLFEIPELDALQSSNQIIRIPLETDVPVTPRIMRLIDSAPFRRLSRIRQLGLVSTVYPGATHSRFEHSLGVYRNALLFLQRLATLPDFHQSICEHECEIFIVAALLHDLGHWAYCHPIEDMRIEGMVRHERIAYQLLQESSIAEALDTDWSITPDEISEVLAPNSKDRPKWPLISNLLSGPIDIDKLDYLDRDSLHAGVPYGRNFDRSRLISQLCIGSDGKSLAITDKARTAAEMMVFARYVMFSEVYWHHTVRSATSMLQRLVWEIIQSQSQGNCRGDEHSRFAQTIHRMDDHQFESEVCSIVQQNVPLRNLSGLANGLFGEQRSFYKRIAEFHFRESPELHRTLARRPYGELIEISNRFAEQLAVITRQTIRPHEVLIDAPPVKLEVQFNIQIRQSDGNFMSLGDLSPVASTLAREQFDNYVKRVRVFVAPHLRDAMRNIELGAILSKCVS